MKQSTTVRIVRILDAFLFAAGGSLVVYAALATFYVVEIPRVAAIGNTLALGVVALAQVFIRSAKAAPRS